MGYNRIGTIDFSQMLVPVGVAEWYSLCRRHYPKVGDEDGVHLADVLNLSSGITRSDTILSAGVDALDPVVLHYKPRGSALDQVPSSSYQVNMTRAEYSIKSGDSNTFLAIILSRIGTLYGLGDFATDFTTDFEQLLGSVDIDGDDPVESASGVDDNAVGQALTVGAGSSTASDELEGLVSAVVHRGDRLQVGGRSRNQHSERRQLIDRVVGPVDRSRSGPRVDLAAESAMSKFVDERVDGAHRPMMPQSGIRPLG